ncbi:MAG: dienelactone hydrolase family protein [Planctomycetes bacterium]|nr:dienelactone hydrolase family protein [Planctomycetota bacterium]
MLLRPVVWSLFLACAPLVAQTTGFLARSLEHGGREHRYVLFVPPGFDPARQWPLILFLHGAGECGTDGWKQVAVGLAPAILSDVAAWPFLVLLPQKPDVHDAWEDHDELVMAMLERTRADYPVDPARIFLTGLSQGGHGTWVLGARHADRFAALAPVCGYGEPAGLAAELARRPIWAFHGEADRAVPVRQSKELVAAVREAGGHAMLSLYPGVGHNAWDRAYRDEGLARWFLIAAADPHGAAYRTRPELVERLVLRVRDAWFTDELPPGGGVTETVIELGPDALSWRRDATVHAGAAPAARHGTLPRQAGHDRLVVALRALEAAGTFDLPSPVVTTAAERAMFAGHALTIRLEVDGEAGGWSFERQLPAQAPLDPALAPSVRAITATVDAILGAD